MKAATAVPRPARLPATPWRRRGAPGDDARPRPGVPGSARRWALGGALGGALLGVLAFAPAAWLAGWVERASAGHLLLAEAEGSVWNGSAVALLAGGPGSRDARALPGRLAWTLRPAGLALRLELVQPCCIAERAVLTLRPGLGTLRITLEGAPDTVGRWPAAWLTGLGTPWNTLQLGGTLGLRSSGLSLTWVQGRWRVEGAAALELQDAASSISTLERLGSYRVDLDADPANAGSARLRLSTQDGALQLSGAGTVGAGGLRFVGEARADAAHEAALSNLLNIIGRRDGARSVIAIG